MMKKINIVKFGEYYGVRIRQLRFFIFYTESYASLSNMSYTWDFKTKEFYLYCITKDYSEAKKVFDHLSGFEKPEVIE